MTAYVIVQLAFEPGDALERYRALAGASIRHHGGRFLVRGARKLFVETPDDSGLDQVVVIAFDTADAARAWYDSAEYAPALALRERAMRRTLFIVDGGGLSGQLPIPLRDTSIT